MSGLIYEDTCNCMSDITLFETNDVSCMFRKCRRQNDNASLWFIYKHVCNQCV